MSKAVIVMPLTGFEELPTKPTVKEATVTKKNPNKTTTPTAIIFIPRPGVSHKRKIIAAEPNITQLIGKSSAVRDMPLR